MTYEPPVKCPITRLLDLMSAKWTVEILREVAIGPTRTRRFLNHIPGLSMKSLIQRLVALEAQGMILRTEYPGKPAKVVYSVTQRGQKLFDLLSMIKEVAEDLPDVAMCKCPLEKECSSDFKCPNRRLGKNQSQS